MDVGSIPPAVLKQDKGPALLAVIWIFAALALITVSIKVWTRFKILHQSGVEDLLIFLAWIFSLIFGAILTASINLGLGKHMFAIDPRNLSYLLKLYLISIPFAMTTLSLPLLAVAILLKHIIDPTPRQTLVLYCLPALQIIAIQIDIILIFTQCTPTSFLWTFQGTAQCLPKRVIIGYVYFVSSLTALTDIFLAVVPVVAFWKLQVKPKAKAVLLLLMSTSAVIEGNVIIIAACVPGLRPFFKHLRRNGLPQSFRIQKGQRFGSATSDASTFITPLSPRRMEPRSSGSVSQQGTQRANWKAYGQNSLERIESGPGNTQPQGGQGRVLEVEEKGKEMEKREGLALVEEKA
ncbi:MAG: hypothetical protein Q9222_000322 [Ikaeria aurantiellina]